MTKKSAIDYVLLSDGLCDGVKSVFIDELGSLDLHSYDVMFCETLDGVPKKQNPTRLMWKTEGVFNHVFRSLITEIVVRGGIF